MASDKLKAVFTQAASCGWSAESTSQLQEWLERFSENVKAKSDDVTAMLEQLSRRTSEVEEQLYNTFNSFSLLSNTQFIENRVYDEDETSSSSDVQAAQKPGPYEAVISPNEALLMALEAHQTVLKSSRFKAARSKRFPYVIGTEEFNRDPFCGLVEQNVAEDYDSEVEKDGVNMAAQMVGTGHNISEAGSIGDASENEDGEPAVSAALDFKSMLEAALRAPYAPYDAGSAPYFSIYDSVDTAEFAGAFDREGLAHKDEAGLSPRTSAQKQEVADLAEAVQRDATIPGSSRPTVSDELFLSFSSRPVLMTPGESSTAISTSSNIWDFHRLPHAAGVQDEQQGPPGPATGSEPVPVYDGKTALGDTLAQIDVPTDVNVPSIRSPAARLSEDEDETTSWSSDIGDEDVQDRDSSQDGSVKPAQAGTLVSNIDEQDDADRAAAETDHISSEINSMEMQKELETQNSNDIFSKNVLDGQPLRTSNLSALLFGHEY